MSKHAEALCAEHGLVFIAPLGSGAFKNAFRASKNGDDVVIKIAKEPGATARDLRETESLHRCDHPRIAKIFSSGLSVYEGVDFHYIIESFCGGDSLGDLIRCGTKLTNKEVGEIGSTLIDCLSYLEAQRLVHRDIKPDNLIINDQGYVTLIDFGLVRDLADVSLTHSWMHMGPGTPFYAAPEQLTNEKAMIGSRTDQFSLGVTLCELIYGVHPYQSTSDSPRSPDTVNRVASRQPHGNCLDAHPHAKKIFHKMTSQWPINRFPNNIILASAWTDFTNIK